MTQPRYPLPWRYDSQDDYDDAIAEYYARVDDYEEWADREIDRRKEEREE